MHFKDFLLIHPPRLPPPVTPAAEYWSSEALRFENKKKNVYLRQSVLCVNPVKCHRGSNREPNYLCLFYTPSLYIKVLANLILRAFI